MGKAARRDRRAWDTPEGRVAARALALVGMLDDSHSRLRRALAAEVERPDRPDGVVWPAWCYAPRALVEVLILRGGARPSTRGGLATGALHTESLIAGAVAAWATGRQAWAVDPDMWDELMATPLDDTPPGPVFRLPHWGIYAARDVEGMRLPPPDSPGRLVGAMVQMSWDDVAERPVLSGVAEWLIPSGEVTYPAVMVPLDTRTLTEGVDEVMGVVADRTAEIPDSLRDPDLIAKVDTYQREVARQVVALALLASSQEPDMEHADALPHTHGPRARLLPPDVWRVGWRIGAAIRAARDETTGPGRSPGERRAPRPHLRRAHWHRYWTGPRDGDRHLEVRWVAPTFVGDHNPGEDPPVTVHRP